ncbi:hypothetical protein MFUR16E_28295 [Methylobacterium fujisawaense]
MGYDKDRTDEAPEPTEDLGLPTPPSPGRLPPPDLPPPPCDEAPSDGPSSGGRPWTAAVREAGVDAPSGTTGNTPDGEPPVDRASHRPRRGGQHRPVDRAGEQASEGEAYRHAASHVDGRVAPVHPHGDGQAEQEGRHGDNGHEQCRHDQRDGDRDPVGGQAGPGERQRRLERLGGRFDQREG